MRVRRITWPLSGALLCALLAACSGSAPDAASSTSTDAPRSTDAMTSAAPSTSAAATPSGREARVTAALAGLDRRGPNAPPFLLGVPPGGPGSRQALVGRGVGGGVL